MKINVYYPLACFYLFQISYHHLLMAWCVRECGLLLSYPVLRLNSNFHFGKRLA